MVRGNVNVSAGNPRISNMPHVQRGQWKKGLVERVPWRSDFNDPVDPNLGRRKQESRYWCLINLNKTGRDDTTLHAMESQLHAMVEQMRTNWKVWLQIFEFGKGARQPDSIKQRYASDVRRLMHAGTIRDVIDRIEVKNFVVERGARQGRVHCHFKFEIFHNSQLRLNYKRMPDIRARMWNSNVDRNFAHMAVEDRARVAYAVRNGRQTRPLFWARLLHERNFEAVSDAYNAKDASNPTIPRRADTLQNRQIGRHAAPPGWAGNPAAVPVT
jgi:hypothetical protein